MIERENGCLKEREKDNGCLKERERERRGRYIAECLLPNDERGVLCVKEGPIFHKLNVFVYCLLCVGVCVCVTERLRWSSEKIRKTVNLCVQRGVRQ